MALRLSALSRFSRDARLLFATTGISAFSFYGIYSLLRVLYILRLGYGPEYVGWFSAAGALTYMGMGLPSGALGSRFGSQKIMFVGGVIVMAGMVAMPMARFVPLWAQGFWPIGSHMFVIAGWSMLNVNLVPALRAATTAQNANSAYALSGALRSLGTFVGTVIGGALPGLFAGILGQTLDAPAPYRSAIWVAAVLSLAGLVPLALVKPSEHAASHQRARSRERFPFWTVVPLVAYVYLHQAGWATCQAFCSAYLDTDLRLPVSSIGLISGTGQFVAILAPLVGSRLAVRYSRGWMLMVTTLGTSVSLVPLALIPHWAAAGVGRIGIVILWAVWLPALQLFQMELVDSQWRSLAYGILSMAMGLGFGTVSLAGGYVIAAWGYRRLFTFGIGLAVAGAIVMWGIVRGAAPQNRL